VVDFPCSFVAKRASSRPEKLVFLLQPLELMPFDAIGEETDGLIASPAKLDKLSVRPAGVVQVAIENQDALR